MIFLAERTGGNAIFFSFLSVRKKCDESCGVSGAARSVSFTGFKCKITAALQVRKNLQGDRPLQRLPSLPKVRRYHGGQRHPVGPAVHRLPSRPWVRLYQEGRQDQQLQGYPEDMM